jgi:hypothetical protein
MSITLVLETYGKAVIVLGDTKPLKDFLKDKGGRWFAKGGGWMFPGSKKEAIKSDLAAHSSVKTVVDKTSGAGASAPAAKPEKKRPATEADEDSAPAKKSSQSGGSRQQ